MSLMKWTQLLGNLGDFLSAIAVIISLVYLAFQVRDHSLLVRENTEAQQMAAEISPDDSTRELNLSIIKDPELLRLVQLGLSDGELSGTDYLRFTLWVRMLMESHMTYFAQTERGLSGMLVWEYWSRYFDRFCSRPHVARIWHQMRDDFDETFRSYIDAKIKSP